MEKDIFEQLKIVRQFDMRNPHYRIVMLVRVGYDPNHSKKLQYLDVSGDLQPYIDVAMKYKDRVKLYAIKVCQIIPLELKTFSLKSYERAEKLEKL